MELFHRRISAFYLSRLDLSTDSPEVPGVSSGLICPNPVVDLLTQLGNIFLNNVVNKRR